MNTRRSATQASGIGRTYESSMNRYVPEDPENRRYGLLGFVVGGLLGLLIGWFVFGWWLAPVQYEVNANELGPSAEADYVSSVADAYAARQDPEALNLALYRLRAFQAEGTLAQTFEATIAYFRENLGPDPDVYGLPVEFNSQARINNLNGLGADLAELLGVDPGALGAAGAPAVEATAPAPTPAADQAAAAEGDQPSTLSQLLRLLLALALMVGGFLLLRYLIQRNKERDDEDFDANELDDFDNGPERSDEVIYPGRAQVSQSSKVVTSRTASDGRTDNYDDHFDYAEDEEPPRPLVANVDREEYADYGFAEDDEDIVEGEYRQTREQAAPYEGDAGSWPGDMDEASRAASTRAGSQVRRISGNIIAEHELRYIAELEGSEYDESFTIQDKQGRTIGSCGMGVNLGNGTIKNAPNQVIALDSWLFDKVDIQRPGDYRRILISEYVVDHEMERIFTGEPTAVGPPIVAQPGTEYKIEGEHLMLLCKILEAEYSGESSSAGAFKQVRVQMRVLKKS